MTLLGILRIRAFSSTPKAVLEGKTNGALPSSARVVRLKELT